MTTYPLSEPATIRRTQSDEKHSNDEVVGQGSLADCAEMLEKLSADERSPLRVDVDDMELSYGSEEVEQLLQHLRDESAGLSDKEIAEIGDPDK